MAADWPAERLPTPAAHGSDLVATDQRGSVPEGPPGPGRRQVRQDVPPPPAHARFPAPSRQRRPPRRITSAAGVTAPRSSRSRARGRV